MSMGRKPHIGGEMYTQYYYCSACGYEDFNIRVGYARTVANGDLCYCPLCGKENFCEEDED